MGHHDVLFPTNLSAGSSFGPGFDTSIIELASGAEERVSKWGGAGKRRYNLAYGLRKPADLYTVQEFFIARVGAANTWRLKDWSDYATSPTGTTHLPGDAAVTNADVQIGIGDATETQFQLFKEYTSGAQTVNRNVELPVAATVTIAVNGAAQTQGADYTVNETTGIVLFTTIPGNTLAITAGFEFETKARFGAEVDLSMDVDLDEFDVGSIGDISVVEVLPGELADPEMAWHGGAKDHGSVSANITLTLAQGRAHRVSPTANIDAILPNLLTIAPGGPIFAIKNAAGANTVDVQYADETTSVIVMAAGAFAEFWAVLGAGSILEWQVK